jgi:hypothetical protein
VWRCLVWWSWRLLNEALKPAWMLCFTFLNVVLFPDLFPGLAFARPIHSHNTTPPWKSAQQFGGAARITRTGTIGEGPKAPPPLRPCLLTSCQRSGLEILWGSNYPHLRHPGRTRNAAAGRNPSGGYPFFTGDTGDKPEIARNPLSSLKKVVPGSAGDKRNSAGDTGDK